MTTRLSTKPTKNKFECTICMEKCTYACICPKCKVDKNNCTLCIKKLLTTYSPLEIRCPNCKAVWTPEIVSQIKGLSKKFTYNFLLDYNKALVEQQEKNLSSGLWFELKVDRLLNQKNNILSLENKIQELNTMLNQQREIYHTYKNSVIMESAPQISVIRCKYLINKEGITTQCCGIIDKEAGYCTSCFNDICLNCGDYIVEDIIHKCKEEDVNNILKLISTTKSCPGCSNFITKIEGCNTMYCIQCNTAFDWDTLELIKGKIHNPMYADLVKEGKIKEREFSGGEDEFREFYNYSTNNTHYPKAAAFLYTLYDILSSWITHCKLELSYIRGRLRLLKEKYRRSLVTQDKFSKDILKSQKDATDLSDCLLCLRSMKYPIEEHLIFVCALVDDITGFSHEIKDSADSVYKTLIPSLTTLYDKHEYVTDISLIIQQIKTFYPNSFPNLRQPTLFAHNWMINAIQTILDGNIDDQ